MSTLSTDKIIPIGSTLTVAGGLSVEGAVNAASLTSKIQPITASIGSSALTITLNPTILDFRSTTLTSGAITSIVVPTAISLTIPSNSTMGTVSTVQSRIVVLAINYNGAVELAAVNIAGGFPLDETTLITTTAAAAGGNSSTAYYSTIARTSVAYRVVGYIESTQAVAGTWNSNPSTIQGMGGQALTAMSSLGYGQRWQDVSRVMGTTYYNTTGKPILISVFYLTSVNGAAGSILVNGYISVTEGNNSPTASTLTVNPVTLIPAGATYSIAHIGTAGTLTSVAELR